MIKLIAIALLIALAVTGTVILLVIGLSSTTFRMEILHYLGALLCVVVSTVFITAALGARKALKAVDKVAQSAQTAANALGNAAPAAGGTLSLESLRSYIPEEYQALVDMLPQEALPEISIPSGAAGGAVSATAGQYIEAARAPLAKRLRSAIIWSIVVTLVLNALLFVLLLNAGGKAKSRYSSSSEDLDLDSDFSSSSSFTDDLD
ncbi:MAG: hypothetical protein IJQ61_06455 [Bacteroidales bacterium]|nr:hypothetical protein [Bacteroidales bacterium]